MAKQKISLKSNKFQILLALAIGLIVGVLGTVLLKNSHAAPLNPSCSGTNVNLNTDYVFAGSGFHSGATYIVTITVPNGSTFSPPAVADANGQWTETWLGSLAGTYTAVVTNYTNHKQVASCSLKVQ